MISIESRWNLPLSTSVRPFLPASAFGAAASTYNASIEIMVWIPRPVAAADYGRVPRELQAARRGGSDGVSIHVRERRLTRVSGAESTEGACLVLRHVLPYPEHPPHLCRAGHPRP